RAAGITSAVALATVTLGTSVVFWRHRRTGDPVGSTVLAWTFFLWGLHHLDYPLLRPLGTGILYGVFADILFIVAATTGTLLLVLGDDRRALEARAHRLGAALLAPGAADARRAPGGDLPRHAGSADERGAPFRRAAGGRRAGCRRPRGAPFGPGRRPRRQSRGHAASRPARHSGA